MAYVRGESFPNLYNDIRRYTCSHCYYKLGDQQNIKQIKSWCYCPYCGVSLKRDDYGKAQVVFPVGLDLASSYTKEVRTE